MAELLLVRCLFLFHSIAQELGFFFGVRLISYGQVDPGFLFHDAAIVGEFLKTKFSVVAAHAAFADTAEGHFAG